ncbi:MAG: hemerythrin domain-containing protein [Peptoniphilus sp.]|nr:hemerythrin domain-containing protein [Peptoniphilus sp.]MDD7363586.1 hemerythrin domain-containing protein [Bacillota bacterium]MDY6045223.1 hemerythrin domain-containing protein [Peptoniphilus sp.]
MYGIDVLENEHAQILRFTSIIRRFLVRALEGEVLFDGEVASMIDFIRHYSDAHHHGKEEEILFRYMLEDLGPVAEKIVRQGMLVEHDQARNIVRRLDEARVRYEEEKTTENLLDVFGLLYNYAFLLEAHAERENTVVYPFAEKNLSEARLEHIDEETKAFEKEHALRSEHYLNELDRWETMI